MTKMTVKQWRQYKGLSQKEFAELIGMKHATYQTKESGRRSFLASEIKNIANVLQISTETQLDW